jgi:SAM-dependent methyltransferase
MHLIKLFVKGQTLDLGAGKLAWSHLITQYARKYISADYIKEHNDLRMIMDATKPFPIKDTTFDTVFCYSVLEHTSAPWMILPEIFRILKPEGHVILSVPFVFYLHGAPHDYFRFSKYGISKLSKDAGFLIERTIMNGGIFHFILNMPSVVISTLLYFLKLSFLIRPVTCLLLKIAQVFDRLFDPDCLFTMNVILVLKKEK